jgi:hypothetical protein
MPRPHYIPTCCMNCALSAAPAPVAWAIGAALPAPPFCSFKMSSIGLLCNQLLPLKPGSNFFYIFFFRGFADLPGGLQLFFLKILFFLQTQCLGVLSAQPDRGFFHYRLTVFSSMFKSGVGNILDKSVGLHINLNLDGEPIGSKRPIIKQKHSVCEVRRFLIFSF